MIQYGMDRKDLLYVMSRLKGVEEKAPRVIKNALNHTAKKARKELAAGAQASYTVKSGGFNSRMKVKNATMRNPTAVIWVKDRTLTIGRFHTSAPKSGGKADIVRAGLKPLTLPLGGSKKKKNRAGGVKRSLKMLKAPLRSLKKLVRNNKDEGKFAKAFKRKGLIMQRETGERYPVKVLRSVSVPKMMEKVYKGERGIRGALEPVLGKTLYEEVETEIKKVIE